LTREEGKNGKLSEALESSDRIRQLLAPVRIHELPCIAHADGPDRDRLAPTLSSIDYDYIAITSPEAAQVFASAWMTADRPPLGTVAAVGQATRQALAEGGIEVGFVPSKATAATLVAELPPCKMAEEEGRATTLLYPASAKAQGTLQRGLEERGFTVRRLNTYDTVPAAWRDEQRALAQRAAVACFASPSAVEAWRKNSAASCALAACIGETSAAACRQNGWKEECIFYPDKPGLEGWANSVADALEHAAAETGH